MFNKKKSDPAPYVAPDPFARRWCYGQPAFARVAFTHSGVEYKPGDAFDYLELGYESTFALWSTWHIDTMLPTAIARAA